MGPKPFSSEPAKDFAFDKVFSVPFTPGTVVETKDESHQNDEENQNQNVEEKEQTEEIKANDIEPENKSVRKPQIYKMCRYYSIVLFLIIVSRRKRLQ